MFLKHNQFSIAVFLLIFLLCLLPGDQVPSSNLKHLDKVVHLSIFALLSFCLTIGLLKQYQFLKLAENAYLITICFGVIYGVLIEVFQGSFLSQRAFEWMDLFADWTGTVLGCLVFRLITWKEDFVK